MVNFTPAIAAIILAATIVSSSPLPTELNARQSSVSKVSRQTPADPPTSSFFKGINDKRDDKEARQTDPSTFEFFKGINDKRDTKEARDPATYDPIFYITHP